MAGRPRKVVDISTGKIGKDKIKARQEMEKRIKLERDGLTPPTWLDDFAKDEFTRVVDEAGEIDILDNLDLSTLSIYCNAYSKFKELTELINKGGKEKFLDGSGNRVSPYINAQEKYIKQINQCSTKLGLATTDRLKLIVPVVENKKDDNPFLKYL